MPSDREDGKSLPSGQTAKHHIFIGWDSREQVASYVAAYSIRKRTESNLSIHYIQHREQRKLGNFARPWLVDPDTGNFRDLVDGKPFSTEFSHTRFLVPHLMGYKGWALFLDADMLCLSDISKLFALCDDKYAVMCVKHLHQPDENVKKMDGRLQLQYHRKNWSSLVLWNCGHHSNHKLTPEVINFMPGRNLHAFTWLKDNEIGELPFTYNYISGISPKLPTNSSGFPAGKPHVIHYTEGGPWFDNCKEVPYAGLWMQEYEEWQRDGGEQRISEIPTTSFELREILRK